MQGPERKLTEKQRATLIEIHEELSRPEPIRHEMIFELKGKGWYVYREIIGESDGQYLFKKFQYMPEDPDIYIEQWIWPLRWSLLTPVQEYFETKEAALKAIIKANKDKRPAGGSYIEDHN